MGRPKKNHETVAAAADATATPTDAPQTVATPTPPETVTERLRREAAEEAEAARAKLAAEREKREAEEAERRAKLEAERVKREEDARRAEERRRADERARKVARAHQILAGFAEIVSKAETTFVHLDKILAAMLAYEADRKAGKADGMGYFERDFDMAMENLASMKSKLRNDLLSNEQMLGARYGWKTYRAMLEEVAAGEAIEREDAANAKGVAA